MRVPGVLGAAFVALLAPWAAGQEPAPVRESAEVSLVEVPVRVMDRDGQPVRGLTAADFTLLDDGRPQEILGLDAIDLAEKALPGGAPAPPAARRRFLILFDFSFARARAVVAARRAARDFVLEELGEGDLAAVATFSVERGVRLLVTFSSDRAQLARAIDTLGLEPGRERNDPLAFAYDSTALAARGAVADGGRGGAQAAAIAEALQAMASVGRARADEYERGRVRGLIQSLGDLGQALDAVEGRKDIILLSEGFHNRFLVGTQETDEERQWLVTGEYWKVDSDKRFGNSPLRREIDQMSQMLRRSDCVIHAVDIAGIVAGTEADGERPIGSENSLFELSNGTGGVVLRNANDLREQLGRMISLTSLVYVLVFRPDRSGTEGRYHELKVQVSAPGAKVSARPGYFERRGFKQLSPLERNLTAADVIANEIPVDDIPARVLATPFASGGESAVVPVLLEIPGDRLLAGEQAEKAGVEVFVYANDAQNRLADFFAQSLSVDLAKGGDRLKAGGLKYYGQLRLPPGDYRLRALVRNADTGRMGLTVSSLRVPAFAAGDPYLLPPVFLEENGAWMAVQGRGATPDDLFSGLAGRSVGPAALPRLAAGSASRLCVVAYHLGGEPGDELRIAGQVLDAEGRPIGKGDLAVLARSLPEADGKSVVLLSFTVPADLSAGRYGLRIFVQETASGQARQASAPFVVP